MVYSICRGNLFKFACEIPDFDSLFDKLSGIVFISKSLSSQKLGFSRKQKKLLDAPACMFALSI